ncbi:hypothetical protein B4N89_07350 [Embleya scabrispora]|uniref:Uncharacterized protein n=1 Tax=Embleya scabrispora TaxID=159449 RepID=A0A1T3NVW4_9ACTN|nr:hypothetical protein B4N89_07350 [Embleya scabrispora]
MSSRAPSRPWPTPVPRPGLPAVGCCPGVAADLPRSAGPVLRHGQGRSVRRRWPAPVPPSPVVGRRAGFATRLRPSVPPRSRPARAPRRRPDAAPPRGVCGRGEALVGVPDGRAIRPGRPGPESG